jgi:hypothetical protein
MDAGMNEGSPFRDARGASFSLSDRGFRLNHNYNE